MIRLCSNLSFLISVTGLYYLSNIFCFTLFLVLFKFSKKNNSETMNIKGFFCSMNIFKSFGIQVFGKIKSKCIKHHYCEVALLLLAEILKSFPQKKALSGFEVNMCFKFHLRIFFVQTKISIL